jgi:hypothetical protein
MFPTHWSFQQFYFECYEAIKNKVSVDGISNTEFRSITPSGVPVEIFFTEEGKFKTIYPTYQGTLNT